MKSVLLLTFFTSILSFKEWWEDSKVVELTDANFHDIVGKDKYVFVEFFTKWCRYCKMSAPEYEKLYEYNKEKRKDLIIARLEGGANQKEIFEYGVFSFPLLALFQPESTKIKNIYQGQRTMQTMDKWLQEQTPPIIKKNLQSSNANRKLNNTGFNTLINKTEFANATNFTEYILKEFSLLHSQIGKFENEVKAINQSYLNLLVNDKETLQDKDKRSNIIKIRITPLTIGLIFCICALIYVIFDKMFIKMNNKTI